MTSLNWQILIAYDSYHMSHMISLKNSVIECFLSKLNVGRFLQLQLCKSHSDRLYWSLWHSSFTNFVQDCTDIESQQLIVFNDKSSIDQLIDSCLIITTLLNLFKINQNSTVMIWYWVQIVMLKCWGGTYVKDH